MLRRHRRLSISSVFVSFTAAFGLLLSFSAAAADSRLPVPAADGKTLAEKYIKPVNGGAFAIVFDKDGRPLTVTSNGRVVPACEPCSEELEQRFGPKCVKALKSTDAAKPATGVAATPSAPLICEKLIDTTVRSVQPISVIRHTGSECVTVIIFVNGKMVAQQLCGDFKD